MADEIDLSQINVNFPVAGITQSSQGFRDNFQAIKENFGASKTKIDGMGVAIGNLGARIGQVEQVMVNLDDQISSAIVIRELEAKVDGLELSTNAKIRNVELAFASADEALAQQITTLSSSTSAGTLALINQESLTRASADSALSQQISVLSATVQNNTSMITNEQTARANADSAMAQRLNKLEVSTTPQPNLVYNPSFVRGLDGWAAYRSTGQDWVVINAGIWGDYVRTLSSASGSNYNGHLTNWFKVQANLPYVFSIDASCLGVTAGQLSYDLQWANDANTILGSTTVEKATNGAGWTRYSGFATAPTGATKARLRFYLSGATNTEAMVRRVKVEQGVNATAFSDEATLGVVITGLSASLTNEQQVRTDADAALAQQITTLGSTVTTNQQTNTSAINSEISTRANADSALSTRIDILSAKTVTDKNDVTALINQEALARTNATDALAQLVTNLTTTVSNNQQSNTASLNSEISTRSNADSALSGRIDVLNAKTVTDRNELSAMITAEQLARTNATDALAQQITSMVATTTTNYNLLTNPSFSRGLEGWTAWKTDTASWSTVSGSADGDYATFLTGIEASKYNGLESTRFKVLPSTNYTVSLDINTQLMTSGVFQYQFVWYGSNNNLLSSSTQNVVNAGEAWNIKKATATSPGNAAFAAIRFRLGNASTAVGNTGIKVRRIKAEAGSTASSFSDDQASTSLIQSTQALITAEEIARTNADSALSGRIDTLSSTVSTNTSNITARIQSEETARADADGALSTRINNLTSTVDSNQTTLNAAIQNAASTLADADSALAGQISNLTTTVNSNNSTLGTRITDEQNARTSAISSMGERVSGVEASITNLNGSLGSINSRVETIEQASSGSNEALAVRTTKLESQIMSLGASRQHPYAGWDFLNTAHGWTVTGATSTIETGGGIKVTANAVNPTMNSPSLAGEQMIEGAKYPFVIIEVENTGSVTINTHSLFYQTSNHVFSGSYAAHPIGGAPAIPASTRMILVYDMRKLTSGGNDWISSNISALRYQASTANNVSFKVWRVQVLGYNAGEVERDLRAALTQEQQTRADQYQALSQTTQALEARIAPNANLLYNSTFTLGLTNWTKFYNTESQPDWSVTNTGVDSDRAVINFANGANASSGYWQDVPVSPSTSYTLALDVKAGNITGNGNMLFNIRWYNSSNAMISETTNKNISTNTVWKRESNTGTSPANAVSARIFIRTQNTITDPQIEIKRIKFETGSEATPWNDETTTGRAVGLINAAVNNESIARAQGDNALSGQISSLSNTVVSNKGTLEGLITNEANTRTNAINSLSNRTSTLESRANTNVNLIPNATAANGLTGWTQTGDQGWTSVKTTDWGFAFSRAFTASTNTVLNTTRFAINQTSKYTLSGFRSLDKLTSGSIQIQAVFRDASDTHLRTDSLNVTVGVGYMTPLTITPPSNATQMHIALRLTNAVATGGGNLLLWKLKLEVGEVATPYGDDGQIYEMLARMSTVDNTLVDLANNKASNSSVSNLTSVVNANKSEVTDFIATQTSENSSLSTRINNLTGTVTSNNNTLTTRIGNEETARTNADSALANRASVLEAKMEGTTASPLKALITAEENARVNAVAAVASRTSSLETEIQNARNGSASLSARLTVIEEATGNVDLSAVVNRITSLETAMTNSPNLLSNSDGMDGLTGWTVSALWTPSYNLAFGNIFGAGGGATGTHTIWTEVDIGVSQIYTLSWTGDGGALPAKVTAKVEFKNASGANVGTQPAAVDFTGLSWNTRKSLTFTTPGSGVTKIRITFTKTVSAGDASFNAFFSRVMLNQGSGAARWSSEAQSRTLLSKITSQQQAISDLENGKASASDFNTLKSEVQNARNGSPSLTAQLDSMRQTSVDLANNKASVSDVNNLIATINPRPNLCPNGGCEQGHTVMKNGSQLNSYVDATWGPVIVRNTFTNGNHAIEFPEFPVREGETYVISGDTGYFHTGSGGNSYLDIIFMSASNVILLDGPQKNINGPHDFSSDSERVQAHAIAVTAPTGAVKAFARAIFTSMSSPTFMGVRRVKVEAGPLPATQFTSEASNVSLAGRIATAQNAIADLDAQKASASDFSSLRAEVQNARNGSGNLAAQLSSMRQTVTDGLGLKADSSTVSSLSATVNLKPGTYTSNPGTSGRIVGDLWMRSDQNNRIYRWSGTAWVDVHDARGETALAELVAARGGKSTLSANIDTINQTIVDGLAGKAAASTVTTLQSTVNGQTSSISNMQSAINGINAKAELVLNGGGKITGYKANSSATESTFDILASRFRIIDPNNNNTALVPFRVEGGSVYINNAFINNLSVGNLSGGTYNGNMLVGGNKVQIDGTIGRILITD